MRIQNSRGTVYYGLHFYPGVCEYRKPGQEPFRVFLNEATIREMGPTFAGRPVFVSHVGPDAVDVPIDDLKQEADGWVVESFFNDADGKHWCKFIVCSERGEDAIRKGFVLSNCYKAKSFKQGGTWSGLAYDKEVAAGEYEHLALVPDPRYVESVVFTPDQFKAYNAQKNHELERLANNRGEEMKLPKLFKREVIQNAADLKLDELIVQLPKSGREVPFMVLVNEADKDPAEKVMAGADHRVMVNGAEMSVDELVNAHKAMCNELDELKGPKEEEDDRNENQADEEEETEEVVETPAPAPAPAPAPEARQTNSAGKERADDLRRAASRRENSTGVFAASVDLRIDQAARGQARYGSGK